MKVKVTLASHLHEENYYFQVSLRDPLRHGADDNELKEIIEAAVCSFCCLDNIVAYNPHPCCGKAKANGTYTKGYSAFI